MKNIKSSVIAKFVAWILLIVSAVFLIGSVVGAAAFESMELYDRTYEQSKADAFEALSDRYSAMVLGQMNTDGANEEYFADKNFKYGIIEAENWSKLQALDLNSEKTYVERNFTEKVVLKDLNVFECYINGETCFSSHNPESLLGSYYVSHSNPEWVKNAIESYVFDLNSGIFYYHCENGKYYPIQDILFTIWEEDVKNIKWEASYKFDMEALAYRLCMSEKEASLTENMEAETYLHIYCKAPLQNSNNEDTEQDVMSVLAGETTNFALLNETSYGTDRWETVNFSRNYYTEEAKDIATEEAVAEPTEGFEFVGGEYSIPFMVEKLTHDFDDNFVYGADAFALPEENTLYVNQLAAEGTNYYVVSFVPETLKNKGESWTEGDLYVQTEYLLEEAYHWKYNIYGLMISSFLLFLAAFIFLTVAAGHRHGEEGISGTWIEKIPLEILWGVAYVAEVFMLLLMMEAVEEIEYITSIFWIAVTVFLAFCGCCLAMGCYLDFVVRVKLGKWWRRTLIWMVCHWTCKKIKQAAGYYAENAGLFRKIILGYGVICFLECIVIFFIYDYSSLEWILFLFLLKAVVLGFLLKCVGEMRKLKAAGEHFAAGDLQYQVDTTKMIFDFKKHGENLNSLSNGLSKAVDARMKSEHFKTELITNVSHDIKTPLTSIINYVDLLKKEEITNEAALEYIEVLDRQSARLKKLIEDLMEASKASTGNLAVNFEKLEAGVFMVQTVGEFEEKTTACNLELLIKKPEEPVYIMADGRHFWRVIDNLMNNICKYAQPETRVYINLEVKDKKVYIVFRNTSKYPLNITSEELMERFVRGDSSRNTEGSGLGLSIARSLMELMHGKFELFVDGDLFKVVLIFDMVE